MGQVSRAMRSLRFSGKARQALLGLACFLFPLLLLPTVSQQDDTQIWSREPDFERWGTVEDLHVGQGVEGAIYYAVLRGHGIYLSHGPGGSWTPISDGLPAGRLGQVRVQSFSVAPDDPLAAYCAVDTVAPGRPHLYGTENGGENWVAQASLTDRRVLQVVVPRGYPSWVYVATESQLYRSTDGGQSWEVRGGWIGSTEVLSMAVSPYDPERIFIGTDGMGLLYTADGGGSWARALPGVSVFALAHGNTGSVIYAGTDNGFYGTNDGGDTWQVRGEEWAGHRVYSIAVSPVDDSTLYIGLEDEGVYRSYDAGHAWIPLKRGLGNATVMSLAVDPAHPWLIYAGTGNGLWFCELFSPGDLGLVSEVPSAPPSPTPEQTATPAPSATQQPTSTSTEAPSETLMPSPTVVMGTGVSSPSPQMPTPTLTIEPTPTPSSVATLTPTVTSTYTPTLTYTPMPTETPPAEKPAPTEGPPPRR